MCDGLGEATTRRKMCYPNKIRTKKDHWPNMCKTRCIEIVLRHPFVSRDNGLFFIEW